MSNIFQVNEKIQFSLDDQSTKLNNNFLIIGPPGCGKTSIMSFNSLKNKNSINQVIIDVKGRMKDLKEKYIEMGYRVQTIDLIHLEESMGYNPLLYVKNDQDLQFLANSLYGDITSYDPYWDMMGKFLLLFTLYYVVHACPLEKRNLRTVFDLIRSINVNSDGFNLEFLLRYYEHFHPEDNTILKLYQSSNVKAEKTASCVLNSLSSKMTPYISEEILNIFSKKEQINFDLLAKEKCVVFITMQDFDTTYHPIINMILSQITKRLYQLADQQESGRLPYNVEFVLDDFGSYTINDFPSLISTGRSRGIWFNVMIQSISQLKKRYDSESSTILECCDRILYMGGNGVDTINYLHDLCSCRQSALSLMPIGKVMFWQRGREGIITDILDISKEPEFCYWNYRHITRRIRKKRNKRNESVPLYGKRVELLSKILMCVELEENLLVSKEELEMIRKLDFNCFGREWNYPVYSRRVKEDLDMIYKYFDFLPKEYKNGNQFIFSVKKVAYEKMFDALSEGLDDLLEEDKYESFI